MSRKRKFSDDLGPGIDTAGSGGLSTTTPDDDTGSWEVVQRSKKSRKKKSDKRKNQSSSHGSDAGKIKNTKPALRYTELHRLKSMVKLSDFQNLALYCVADDVAPQWVSVQNHTQVHKVVMLMVPGLERAMFTGELALPDDSSPDGGAEAAAQVSTAPHVHNSNDQSGSQSSKNPDHYLPIQLSRPELPSALRPLAEIFEHLWPVKASGDDRHGKLYSPLNSMLSCFAKSQDGKKKRQQNAGHSTLDKDWVNQRTPITSYLASVEDMYEADYTLHPACVRASEREALKARREQRNQGLRDGWRDTHVNELEESIVPESEFEQGSITAGHTVYTIDCEMCLVGPEEQALTRISVVDWGGDVVMDELVKPSKPITNYLTQFSGISEGLLEGVSTTLTDIQDRLIELCTPRTILVGHSLESDLRALKLTHPFVVDTAILYPHVRGPPLRCSLKWLAQKYLGREIQQGHGSSGHDSVEDARATLALIKQKCERGPDWGTTSTPLESIFKRISRSRSRLEGGGDMRGLAFNAGAVVDTHPGKHGLLAPYCITAADDKDIVTGVRRAVHGDVDGAYVPGNGVVWTWARLRDLEKLRGWTFDRPTDEPESDWSEPPPHLLAEHVAAAVARIQAVHASLPPCTLFMVYSGTADPREFQRLLEQQRTFRREYAVKKWDELSVQWTDTEVQALKQACQSARQGVGLVTIT